MISDALLLKHDVLVPTDNTFQRQARLRQALWRVAQGLRPGDHRGRPLGSRLPMPDAKDKLTNYLTDTIREVVRREVLDPARRGSKLFGEPRIWNDLLSSQPLCFNLFGELQADLALATRAFAKLTSGRMAKVTAIDFEFSPGRGLDRYTGDRSAFDVFVQYVTPSGGKGFAGIEVKYHESLNDKVATHRTRYDEIAVKMGAFRAESIVRLKKKPLQQIWRDHLLAGCLLQDESAGYDDGFFAFLHPSENDRCVAAVEAYRRCLVDGAPSFVSWTQEDVVTAIRVAGAGAWIEKVGARYLASGRR